MGIDLGSAGNLVAKSIGSSTNALKRYGIDVEGAAGSSTRFDSVLQGLTRQVEGLAEAAANAGTGSLVQFKNAIDDIKEVIGANLFPYMDGLAKRMTAFSELQSGTGPKNYATQLNEQARAALKNIKTTEEANKKLEEQKVKFKELIPELEITKQQLIELQKEEQQKGFGGGEVNSGYVQSLSAQITEIKSNIQGVGEAIKVIDNQISSGKSMEWVPVNKDIIDDGIETLGELKGKLSELNQQRDEVSLSEIKAIDNEISAIEAKIQAYNKSEQSIERQNTELVKLIDLMEKFDSGQKVINTVIEEIRKTVPEYPAAEDAALAPGGIALPENSDTKVAIGYALGLADATDKATLATESLNNALNGVGSQLAQGADSWADYGKSVVNAMRQAIAGIIAEGIASVVAGSLKSSAALGPFAVGIGALAGGAAAGLFSTIVPKLAEGGLAYAPTMAVVGDNNNASVDPEVIAPLSKLQSMMSISVIGSTRIRGRDIDIAWTREQNFKNRT